ncbi:helix-turn-helix domain-containing protein [Roseateles cellulosilyticus]|uniref:Helix-turn-helix transcriptional regulator n=1 Tax=Pelomonas cellulosilytica TaxID=2906762 RepID=A0ABS8XXV8_9BURK|nr:helix-turn-helix domain-containing protein [Pelomonas sp. P8]MCE4556657.1 helix-turn-helix transcriptional regulator [Pelomonas sp. P8]
MPSIIAAVFDSNFRGSREGEGWRISSVPRDVATVCHITTGAFACSTEGVTSADGGGFCTHIVFLRAGKLTVDQHAHQHRLVAGDIFVACGWQPMALAGTGRVDMLVITLPGWWSMQRFLDNYQILPELYIPAAYFAAPIIGDLAQLILDLDESDALAAPQALTMLGDLLRTALAAGAKADRIIPRARGRMGEILWFIAQNLEKRGLSAPDAAKSLKCSVRTIYNTCASHGTSFSALVTETRLVAAQYQLIRTNDRISQIAYEVGFSSLSHFSRLFRARFGVTAKAMAAGNRAEVIASRSA